MTVRTPERLLRLGAYVPGRPIEAVEREFGLREVAKLASNENPFGPSPRALEAIRAAAGLIHRYPDGSGHELRAALAAQHRVAPEQVVLGNGSSEIIEMLARAFLPGGRNAVVSEGAFILYRLAPGALGAEVIAVPLRDHRHDLPAMAAACSAGTALCYIGNPNNPTGTCVGRAALAAYFERLPPDVLTVLDEAYIDYVEDPDCARGAEALAAGRDVAVLRTFSKIHGLAGLRIGYALTTPAVAAALEAVRSPFNTSSLAQAGALAALGDGDHVARSRSENARLLRLLQAELAGRGLAFVPSVTNFVLLMTSLPGDELFRRLLPEGVIVRPMGVYGFPFGVRVSVGTEPEIRKFLAALDRVLLPPQGSRSTA